VTTFNPAHPVPCVYLKHGSYWLVKGGVWTRIGKTLEESLAEYARRVSPSASGKFPALIESTLQQHMKAQKLAKSTRQQYRLAADILKRKFAAFDSPDQVKGRHVAKIKTDGSATPNMTNRVVSLLRTLFGYWVEAELCDGNPCIGVKRHAEPKRTRYLTDDEWWSIHAAAGLRLRAIMRIEYLTGQRIGDVLKIRRSQITESGIEFKQQKTGARLVVKWSPALRSAVADALALHGGVQSLTLFVGRDGKPPDYRSVLRQWHVAANAAGVADSRPNDQRAKAATDTRRQGGDATALLGHTSQAMTERYIRDREAPEVDGPNLRQSLDVGQKGA